MPLSRLGLCAEEIAETIMEALSLGKSGSLITRYKAEKDLEISNQKYELELAVDEGLVKTFVADETSALSVEPVNAELTRVSGGFEVSQSQTGIKVNADATAAAVMAALKDWDGGDVSVAATAEVSQPERTTEMLSQVQDVLGTFSTSTSSANSSKLQNLRVGVSHTTDILIMPGETWSMHDALAPFNAENGYVKQVAYSNGGYVDEYGGGICQLATTLYNAALLAEVNISERYNHSMTVGYTDYGLDATINDSGSKDLKITNDFDFPIYIEASVNGSYNTYTIWGKETRPANRELKFYGVTLSESYLPEQVTEDPTLAPGQRVVEQATSYPEAVAQAWKEIWVDGVLEEKILLHTDKYRASPRKIRQNSAAAPETEAPETEAPDRSAHHYGGAYDRSAHHGGAYDRSARHGAYGSSHRARGRSALRGGGACGLRILLMQSPEKYDILKRPHPGRDGGLFYNGRTFMRPGQDIVIVGHIGAEGTVRAALENRELLLKTLPREFVDRAAALEWRQGLAEELRGQFPGSFVREAGEGGIFAALWNMAEACNAGFTVDMKKLPILQETIEVCEALELNPYEIASGGCAVLAADHGNDIVWGLGPSAVFVGKVTKGRTGSS